MPQRCLHLLSYSLLLSLFCCVPAVAWEPVGRESTLPGLEALLSRLDRAVLQRDQETIISLVHPQCVVSYGGFRGPEDFRDHWFRDDGANGRDFFDELRTALEIGGAVTNEREYLLPYTALAPPMDAKGVLLAVVVAPAMNVRAGPGLQARIVGSLQQNQLVRLCNIVVPVPVNGMNWVCVLLKDGSRGYVAEHLLTLPTRPRFRFRLEDGRWWLVSTVAGE